MYACVFRTLGRVGNVRLRYWTEESNQFNIGLFTDNYHRKLDIYVEINLELLHT